MTARSDLFGAHLVPGGVRFAVPSENASSVVVSFFSEADGAAECRVSLDRGADGVWRTTVPGLQPGILYGYRVDGPYAPQLGHRFNPAKLLVDPWARAITGEPRSDRSLFAFALGEDPDRTFSSRDSAAAMPKSVVVDPAFDWQGTRRPRTPWRDTLIYEAHVRGLTMRHPDVEPHLRGTYLGLASLPVIEHLQALGVTAVELLPVQQFASEPHLWRKGLGNYWGYSTLGFLAPHAAYAASSGEQASTGEQVREWKVMVRELHRAGIEVLLDVVYNHTAEGGYDGPTLSLRGLDNAAYYRLRRRNRRRYVDVTGCGNTLDLSRPAGRELVLSSLRYWVCEMGVDGFRFDLAPALGRNQAGVFDPGGGFLQAVAEDPVLAGVKLIAEPWDVGPDGYHLGRFPTDWAEWNDRYRDVVRGFWRDPVRRVQGATELGRAVAGELPHGKPSDKNVCFVTCHDGFTLRDLTSYAAKHNEANHEDNRDGHDHNLSSDWGVEGETEDRRILAARRRARRNLLVTLLLSRGVPMLSHGDELGRTQKGNNNAYCQDNETSWVDWTRLGEEREWLDFVCRAVALRRAHPGLCPSEDERAVTVFAEHVLSVAYEGGLLLLLNGSVETVPFVLAAGDWEELLTTAPASSSSLEKPPAVSSPAHVEPFSLRLLRAE